jgi:hypothetical protein
VAGNTKNQHYIPQSYLNRFSDSQKLSVYLVERNKLLTNQNARNYAAHRYYYDTEPSELEQLLQEYISGKMIESCSINSSDQQFIEHALSRSEADISHVFDELISNPSRLGDVEVRAKLIIFFHDLAYRIEAYRNTQEYMNAVTYDALKGMMFPTDATEYIESTYGAPVARKEQLKKMTSLSDVLRTCNTLLNEYEWFWGNMIGAGEFILSDDPLCELRYNGPEIIVPISKTNAIILRKKNINTPIMGTNQPQNGIIEITTQNAVKYAILSFCTAKRYVFGSEKMLKSILRLLELSAKAVHDLSREDCLKYF